MRSDSSSIAFTFCTLIHSSTSLIHFVHYIHSRTALIFCALYPWLYEVFAELSCSSLQCGWFYPTTDSSSELRRILSYNWLEFWWLETSCGWFYHTADSSSSGWIGVVVDSITTADSSSSGWTRVAADSILWLFRVLAAGYELWLIPSCGWLRVAADSVLRLTQDPLTGFDLQLTYTLIYSINLRTYSAKYTIFIVCFPSADFSYHWFRLWLLLQEPWGSLKKLEEAWGSMNKLQDFSCNWFKLQWLIQAVTVDSRPLMADLRPTAKLTTSRILSTMTPDKSDRAVESQVNNLL